MKIGNLIFKILLLVLIMAGIAVGVLVTVVNPNKFKPMIQAQLTQWSGRSITIKGDLKWQFFPHLGIKATQVDIANPEGYSEPQFALVKSLSFKVDTLPLLKRQIQIPEIDIQSAKINLEILPNLQNNWSDFAKSKETKSTDGQSMITISTINIHRFTISNSSVSLKNKATQQTLAIKHFNFDSHDLDLNKSFPITTDFDFNGSEPRQSTPFNFKGHAAIQGKIALDAKQYEQSKMLSSAINFDGKIDLKDILLDKLHLTSLSTTVALHQSSLKLSPVQAALYGGKATGKITVGLQQSPSYKIEGNLNHLAAGPFLQDIVNSGRITGNLDLSFNLAMSGKTATEMAQTLNGQSKFGFHDGVLVGVDLPVLVDTSVDVLNKKESNKKAQTGTPFGTISGNLSINHGEITNPDFLFNSEKFNVKGNGTVNLNSHQIHYQLKAQVLGVTEESLVGKIQKELGGDFPLIVSGTWDNITAKPDMTALLSARARLLLKESVDHVLKNKLGGSQDQNSGESNPVKQGVDLLTGKKSNPSTPEPAAPSTPVKPAEKAKNLLKSLLPH